ncbi:MAG TPA: glycoside hydrolase family 57 protein [Cytophagales bacterium]|nr:glycoside hydrolase family 57 protein [Cytophagales bacterium]
MPSIHLYFQVHQPYRLQEYTFFDIGAGGNYFNDELNRTILDKVSDKCYLPTNRILLSIIERFKGLFSCTFSFSGVFIEQLQQSRPDVLESFQKLVDTGQVELLSETYYHSLASLKDASEFDAQVLEHGRLIKTIFNYTPKVFRNTELIFHKELLQYCDKQDLIGVLAEGAPQLLDNKHPGQVFALPKCSLKLLCRNFELSDEVAYRFSDKSHPLYPLTAQKFRKLIEMDGAHDCVSLFMDYETFGEHHWEETKIFNFLEELPQEIIKYTPYRFSKIEQTLAKVCPQATVTIESTTSWADTEKDLSAWLGNAMQQDALHLIYELKEKVMHKGDEELIKIWRKLQTSDHFYYMSTKKASDGEVHNYFSPYRSPYDAYLYYTNVIKDITLQLS